MALEWWRGPAALDGKDLVFDALHAERYVLQGQDGLQAAFALATCRAPRDLVGFVQAWGPLWTPPHNLHLGAIQITEKVTNQQVAAVTLYAMLTVTAAMQVGVTRQEVQEILQITPVPAAFKAAFGISDESAPPKTPEDAPDTLYGQLLAQVVMAATQGTQIRNCPQCHKFFELYHPRATYCGRQCYRAAAAKRGRDTEREAQTAAAG